LRGSPGGRKNFPSLKGALAVELWSLFERWPLPFVVPKHGERHPFTLRQLKQLPRTGSGPGRIKITAIAIQAVWGSSENLMMPNCFGRTCHLASSVKQALLLSFEVQPCSGFAFVKQASSTLRMTQPNFSANTPANRINRRRHQLSLVRLLAIRSFGSSLAVLHPIPAITARRLVTQPLPPALPPAGMLAALASPAV
jgi:hypothetical protein